MLIFFIDLGALQIWIVNSLYLSCIYFLCQLWQFSCFWVHFTLENFKIVKSIFSFMTFFKKRKPSLFYEYKEIVFYIFFYLLYRFFFIFSYLFHLQYVLCTVWYYGFSYRYPVLSASFLEKSLTFEFEMWDLLYTCIYLDSFYGYILNTEFYFIPAVSLKHVWHLTSHLTDLLVSSNFLVDSCLW